MMKSTLSCSTERTRALCLLGALVIASGVAGCSQDECSTPGEFRCVGNNAETCVWAYPDSDKEGLVWSTSGCAEGQYCRTLDPSVYNAPICALAPEPDPRCARADQFSFCDGNVVTICMKGYVTGTHDCTTGFSTASRFYPSSVSSTGYCQSSENSAVCAMDTTPNPLCGTLPGGNGNVCDGNKLLGCVFGYRTGEFECPSPGACISDSPAFCAPTTIRYPGCSTAKSLDFACKDGHIARCIYGYLEVEEVCPTGTTCVVDQYSHTPLCSSVPQYQ